jgi:colanic acid/amylovoran biosynthesis glycosyltransferase
MRSCIVTKAHFNPHQTMVNNHVANLFGGDVVVMAADRMAEDPHGRPAHFWAPGSHGRRAGLWQDALSLLRHRTTRVPEGAAREGMLAFLSEQRVAAVLVEFGDLAARATPALAASGLPLFIYFRGSDASEHLARPFRAEALRRMMPRLAGVFAVSRFLLDQLAARDIRHPESHVIPSGVDTDRFIPGEKRPARFLAVGRLIEKKRPDITVAAFCRAARGHPEARLDLIGDGPLADRCRAIAAEHGMADRVSLRGRQPHDAVRAALAEAAVFLQHSVTGRDGDTEGLPTAIQEAMAAGAVVISTRHAGIPEAVEEGMTGWLVAEGDAAGFEARIRDALERPHQLPPMADRARAVAVERFDNRRLTRLLEARMRALSGR